MKVAVSALGASLDAKVDGRFGRAQHLLIVQTPSMRVENLDNKSNRDALQGAGIGAAELVAGAGAEAVITGHLGPKAYRALEMVDIQGFRGTGMTVREAVAALDEGALVELGVGESHSGMA